LLISYKFLCFLQFNKVFYLTLPVWNLQLHTLYWAHRHFKRIPAREEHIIAHHTAHDKLDSVENNENGINIFSKCLYDWDVPSLCQIPSVRISGRQFFACEGIRQAKKLLDFGFMIAVMRTKLKLVNESVVGTSILSCEFIH
jgi:hypothetical protein